jgi:AcrR family transcriptional regulator
MNAATRTLQTAESRREDVLQAAVKVFAARGLHSAPTADVAKAAGISHAYLFRLFPKKADLAVAVIERCHDRIHETFAQAAAEAKRKGEDPLHAMGEAYGRLLADRDLVLVQLHSHAASPEDPVIREASRRGFKRLVEVVERESGASEQEIGRFFAIGMLMNVMAALDAASLDEHWSKVLVDYCLED